ncbi:excalibur calcium-binding domain-containing protein [Microbacterium abyssi]|uniref:excalibur calcium-binding domain-containing protein n=1 Tax=Microbacterium abyssi TaxID=2782166 RepID=UPI0018893C0D|nr:excalibur calcium-binding domain-containing protein [Microbacterium sp. A18JL241]
MANAFIVRSNRLLAGVIGGILVAGMLVVTSTPDTPASADDGVVDVTGPTVSGSAIVGAVLTLDPSSLTLWDAPAYQWLRAGSEIAGATAVSYEIGPADVGALISVRVTGRAVDDIGAELVLVSAPTAPVAVGSLTSTTPTLSGTFAVGSTLTAKPGGWSAGVSFRYQWLRNGAKISAATAASYRLTSADSGKQISVTITGTKNGYTAVTKTSARSAKVLTVTTPKITGTAKVGATLSANKGTWSKGTAFSYQWLRNGTSITGAKGAAYKLTAADAGNKITLALTGRLSGYATVSKTSSATSAVARGTLTASAPKISGTTRVASKLTAKAGTWTSGATLKYQWYRNGAAIAGATSSSYTVRPTDAYARITVKVTGAKAGYVTAAKSSSATAAVQGKVYANCAQLNKDYPDGIRKSNVTVDRKAGKPKPLVGKPYPSTSLYNLQSSRRDADRDGIMCER